MFEQLRRRDDMWLERRYDNDALRSTSLVDRDVTTATRSTLELPRQAKCCYSETWRHDNLESPEKSLIWTDLDDSLNKLRNEIVTFFNKGEIQQPELNTKIRVAVPLPLP